MNAKCVFKLKQKIDVVGMDLDDSSLLNIKQMLIQELALRNAELVIVEDYMESLEMERELEMDMVILEEEQTVDAAFFEINIDLESEQIEYPQNFYDVIFEKVAEEIASEHVYLSGVWARGDEQHFGFIKDNV